MDRSESEAWAHANARPCPHCRGPVVIRLEGDADLDQAVRTIAGRARITLVPPNVPAEDLSRYASSVVSPAGGDIRAFADPSLGEPYSEEAVVHDADEDCDVDGETDTCVMCGAFHGGDPCADCGAYAYHRDGCPHASPGNRRRGSFGR